MSLKQKSIRTTLLLALLMFVGSIAAQTVKVNVKDRDGEGVIGASVVESGTTNGGVTDFDGNYTIKLSGKSSNITVSFIGMKSKTVSVKGKSSVNIVLEEDDNTTLNDVVVIGYTTVRKKDLTGAVAQVSGKQIEDIPVTNVTEALTGKMAGVNVTTTEGSPDAEINIRVRGGGSISQDNSPLYIVDGFEVSSINDIPSSDIETIDVLKDAASTAIYGARGANGVIIVTTKGGKTDGGVQINLNTSYGWEKVVKEIGVMDPYNFGMYQYELASGSQFSTDKGNYGIYSELNQLHGIEGKNWQDMIFGRTGKQRNIDLSVAGGDKKFNYNISYAYVDKDAIMLGSGLIRNNISAKLSGNLNKWLTADFKFALSHTKVYGLAKGTDSNESNATNSWSNKSIRYAPINAISSDGTDFDEESSTRVDPLTSVRGTSKKSMQLKHNYNFGLTWKPWKGWKFKTQLSFGWDDKDTDEAWLARANNNSKYENAGMGLTVFQTDHKKTITNTNTVTYDRKKIFLKDDKMTALLGQEWKQTKQTKSEDVYTGYSNEYDTFDLLFDNTASAKRMAPWNYTYPDDRMASFFGQLLYTIGDKYYLNATLRADGSSKFGEGHRWGWFPAAQLAWRISEEEFMKNANWISNLKLRLSIGTAGNNRIDPGLQRTQYIQSATTGSAPYFDEQRTTYLKTNGYLYNPNLKWETTITRNIGIDYGFFKGRVSGSFDFYWNSTNDLLMRSRVQSSSGYLYQYQNFGSTENKGVELTTNVAIIENKRLSFNGNLNIAYNKNKITKLTNDDPYQSSSFAGSTIAEYNDFYVTEGGRLGEIWGFQHNGFYTADELILGADGKWNTKDGKNLTYSEATIYPGAPKYVDQNGDGKIDAANDKVRLGNTVPTWTGGFGFDATWRNNWGTIDAAIFFNYSLGNKILNGTKLANSFYAGSSAGYNLISEFNYDNRYAWVDPATGLNIGRPSPNTIIAYGGANAIINRLNEMNEGKALWCPSATSAMVISDWALENASFLRLQSITIGYSLPKAWLKKIYLQKVRIYFTGHNLACWTKYKGYDPEVSASSNPMCPGIDFAMYPKSRSYTMGLNIQF